MRRLLAPAILGAFASLHANPPILISPPVGTPTVIASLTTQPSANNQSLLSQINGSLVQRRTDHQILTSNAILRTQPVFIRPR